MLARVKIDLDVDVLNADEINLERHVEDVITGAVEDESLGKIATIETNPFTEEEMTSILEIARVVVGDAKICDIIKDEMDISDDYMFELGEKVINKLEG
jgi:hypothetical protein